MRCPADPTIGFGAGHIDHKHGSYLYWPWEPGLSWPPMLTLENSRNLKRALILDDYTTDALESVNHSDYTVNYVGFDGSVHRGDIRRPPNLGQYE